MTLDRAIQIKNDFRVLMQDSYYGWGKHQSHKAILAHIKEKVYDNPDYAKLPRWARTWLQGYETAIMDSLFSLQILEWRVSYRGEYVTSDKIQEGTWSEVGEGAHFWKGTDKVFVAKGGEDHVC